MTINIIRQAIVTKFLGPTNTRGSRIKASAYAGSVTISYDHALNSEQNHAKAARALASKFDWKGHWYLGGTPDQSYVAVCVDLNDQTTAFTIQAEG